MKAPIYIDASVVGGWEDDEFADHSLRFMQRFVDGDGVLVVSTLTLQELAAAPANVRRHLASVPDAHIETLELDAEARDLAESTGTTPSPAKEVPVTGDTGSARGVDR